MTDYGDTAVWMLEFLQKQHWQPKFDAEAFAAFLWESWRVGKKVIDAPFTVAASLAG